MKTETPEQASARIRAQLKMTSGARLCGFRGCQVITQGGAAGLKRHREQIHPEWIFEEEPE